MHTEILTLPKGLPTGSADVLIADAPYNIGKDFGNNDDQLPLEDYVAWSKEWIVEGLRVLAPTGSFYVYGFSEILADLSAATNAKFKRWLIWHYTNKNVASSKYWQRSHEAILVLGHGKPTFNRDDVREPYTEAYLKNAAGKVRAATPSRFSTGTNTTVYAAHANGALPRDVIKVPALAGGAGARERAHFCATCDRLIFGKSKKDHQAHDLVTHPTQKPAEVTRRLIRAAKNSPGVTNLAVLFAGSGAELAVAYEEGCNVTGFDINPDYVRMGNAWLDTLSRK